MGMVALDVNRRPASIEQIRSALHALDLQQRMQYGLPSSSQFPLAPYPVFPAPSSLSSLPPPSLSSHYPAPGNFSAFGAAPHPAASPPHPTAPGFGAFGASPGPSYRSASVQSRPRARQIQIQPQIQPSVHAYGQSTSAFYQPSPAQAFGAPPFGSKQPNRHALASLGLGLATLFGPSIVCAGKFSLFPWSASPRFWLLLGIISLGLPLSAIIFGHKGQRRARAIGGSQDAATAGMIMGYVLGAVYVVPALVMIFLSLYYLFSPH